MEPKTLILINKINQSQGFIFLSVNLIYRHIDNCLFTMTTNKAQVVAANANELLTLGKQKQRRTVTKTTLRSEASS